MTIPPIIGALLLTSAAGNEMEAPRRVPSPVVDQDAAPRTTAPPNVPDPAQAAPDGASAMPSDPLAGVPQETPDDPAPQEEIVVTARSRHAPDDPLERVNAVSFALTQKVDDAITAPAAKVFKQVLPGPARRGVRSFLNNLREPVVFVNYLLQLKPGKAAETVGRFAVNSTLGVGGVVDVAKRCPFRLPWRPNGFSDTLGVYGVPEGPFVFLPLIGPTTVRELVGGGVDRLASPIALGGPFRSRGYLIGSNIYRALDRRAEQEEELAEVRQSEDPYTARRNLFLRKREARIARLTGDAPHDDGASRSVDDPPGAPAGPGPGHAASPAAAAPMAPGEGCGSAGQGGAAILTGPRIGLSIGLDRGADRIALPGLGDAVSRRSGPVARASLGYDVALGGGVIAGAEIGISSGGPAIRGQLGTLRRRTDPGLGLDAVARLGIMPSPELLLYGKGGWAMQRLSTEQTDGGTTVTRMRTDHGLLWGVGVEYALTPRTALRVDLDRVRFGEGYSRNRLLSGINLRF